MLSLVNFSAAWWSASNWMLCPSSKVRNSFSSAAARWTCLNRLSCFYLLYVYSIKTRSVLDSYNSWWYFSFQRDSSDLRDLKKDGTSGQFFTAVDFLENNCFPENNRFLGSLFQNLKKLCKNSGNIDLQGNNR